MSGQGREQPGAAAGRAALLCACAKVQGSGARNTECALKPQPVLPHPDAHVPTLPAPCHQPTSRLPLPGLTHRARGLEVVNVLGHLSLAPRPGGRRRHAAKRPAPATGPRLAEHKGGVGVGLPSRALGKECLRPSQLAGCHAQPPPADTLAHSFQTGFYLKSPHVARGPHQIQLHELQASEQNATGRPLFESHNGDGRAPSQAQALLSREHTGEASLALQPEPLLAVWEGPADTQRGWGA